MKHYLIDSENVGDFWIPLLEIPADQAELIVFYTKNSPHMSYDSLIKLKESDRTVTFIKCYEGTNALDFQLCSELGFRIARDESDDFIIVTNDTGYDAAVKYWRHKQYSVKRIAGKDMRTGSRRRGNLARCDVAAEVSAILHKLVKAQEPDEKERDAADLIQDPAGEAEQNNGFISDQDRETDSVYGSGEPDGTEDENGYYEEPDNEDGDSYPDESDDDYEPDDEAYEEADDESDDEADDESDESGAQDDEDESDDAYYDPEDETADESDEEDSADEKLFGDDEFFREPLTDTAVDETADPGKAGLSGPEAEDGSKEENGFEEEGAEEDHENPDPVEKDFEQESSVDSGTAAEPLNREEPAEAEEDGEKLFIPDRDEIIAIVNCIGMENLAELHNQLIQFYGDNGKDIYLALKSGSLAIEKEDWSKDEKFLYYCALILRHSDEPQEALTEENIREFAEFVQGAESKRKNLNSLRYALLKHYGKEKGRRYYFMLKPYVKVLNQI